MTREYRRRLSLLFWGQVVSAVGVAMLLQANVGVEPWSVLQQGMSLSFGITYGTAAMIVGAAVVATAVLMGEGIGLGTLSNVFICPVMIDLLLWSGWIPRMRTLWSGLLMLLGGIEVLAVGTWLYMASALGSGPRDALMVVLARRTRWSVGLCRIAVEAPLVAAGWLLGGQVGVGTVVSAFGVGTLFNLTFNLVGFRAADVRQENLSETFDRLRNRDK